MVDIYDAATKSWSVPACLGGSRLCEGSVGHARNQTVTCQRSESPSKIVSLVRSISHLAANRSNLMGTSVSDRYVVFAGGTTIGNPGPDVCGTVGRSVYQPLKTYLPHVPAGGGCRLWVTDSIALQEPYRFV